MKPPPRWAIFLWGLSAGIWLLKLAQQWGPTLSRFALERRRSTGQPDPPAPPWGSGCPLCWQFDDELARYGHSHVSPIRRLRAPE